MSYLEVMEARHSVRSYTHQKIEGKVLDELRHTVDKCNNESGLNIQLCLNEPNAFAGMMAHYGKFRNVKNYIALIGRKGAELEEKCGYYGEKIVLEAQRLGLNTCWVAMTYSKGKSAATVNAGEKLLMVITIGYGENPGVSHKTKPIKELCKVNGDMPNWFRSGMQAAQLAPTATNQQKFYIELSGNTVKATPGFGFYTKVDMGIVKYPFELGADDNGWQGSK